MRILSARARDVRHDRVSGRIAAARGADVAAVQDLIGGQVRGPLLGLYGLPRVNVLETNLALDATFPLPAQSTGN